MRSLIFLVACCVAAAPVAAQTIDPGMTREQVVAKLGEPLSTRTYQGHSYLLYKNGCEKTCGMNDLVVLDSGRVVDAVFRAPGRKYSGQSSSPRMISAADARRGPDGALAPLALLKAPAKSASPAPVKKPPAVPSKTAAPPKTVPPTKVAAPTKVPPASATKAVQPPATKPPATPAKKPAADSGKKAAPAPAKKPPA